MASWYQENTPTRLSHDTEWTVVEDPPLETRCLFRFTTKAEADAYRDHIKDLHPSWSVYTLRPSLWSNF